MKRTFMSALAIMAMAGLAKADGDIWLSAGGTGGALGGTVLIPTIGGSGSIQVILDYDGGSTTTPDGTGWAIGFDGFWQTRDQDVGGPAGNGLSHFVATSAIDHATGILGGLMPNDPFRGLGSFPNPVGSVVPGFGAVFVLVDNQVGIGEGYFGGTGPVVADELIIEGTAENVLPDAVWLLGGGLAPTWVEVTEYLGNIDTAILLPLGNMSSGPASAGAVNVQVLPEPASLALLLIGGLAAARRRR